MVTILPQIHQLWGKGDFAELADGWNHPLDPSTAGTGRLRGAG